MAEAQKILEKNQLPLRTDQYRGICRENLQVKCNWQMGNFTKLTRPVHENSSGLTMSDDFVAWHFGRNERRCVFLDTESMELEEFHLPEEFKHFNEMVLFWRDVDSNKLEIVDPKTRWVVDVEDEGGWLDYESGVL
jgi:hypothetical protein